MHKKIIKHLQYAYYVEIVSMTDKAADAIIYRDTSEDSSRIGISIYNNDECKAWEFSDAWMTEVIGKEHPLNDKSLCEIMDILELLL